MYPPHHLGGYELVWESAMDHLRALGGDVAVLTTDSRFSGRGGDAPHVFRRLRWAHRDGEFQPTTMRERIAIARHNHGELERCLAQLRPQVVTWWSMGGLTLTMLEAVRRLGLPAVAFVHDDWLVYGPLVDDWLRMFRGARRPVAPLAAKFASIPASVDFDRAASYVFVSEDVRTRAADHGLRLERTSVAPSGIDPIYCDPAPQHGWSWRLLYVGRLDPRKGVETVVEALVHLPSEARLEIAGAGDGQEDRRLQECVRELGLEGRVHFTGHLGRQQLHAAYEAADVVVFPVTWPEPWGLVPLEAMARGRAVVATGRGGSAEYMRDGENCLLFAAGDPAGLARTVARLAEDEALRARLAEGGVQTASHHTRPRFNEAVELAVREARAATG